MVGAPYCEYVNKMYFVNSSSDKPVGTLCNLTRFLLHPPQKTATDARLLSFMIFSYVFKNERILRYVLYKLCQYIVIFIAHNARNKVGT